MPDKTIPKLHKVNHGDMFHYLLIGDNGCCDMYLPIVLEIGSLFSHEFGIYKVWQYREKTIDGADYFSIYCDRVKVK